MTYKIITHGKLDGPRSRTVVREKLAALFHTRPEKLDLVFSGCAVVLCKGLSRETAEKYLLTLQGIGLGCEILSEGPTMPAAQPVAASPKKAIPEKVSPKCDDLITNADAPLAKRNESPGGAVLANNHHKRQEILPPQDPPPTPPSAPLRSLATIRNGIIAALILVVLVGGYFLFLKPEPTERDLQASRIESARKTALSYVYPVTGEWRGTATDEKGSKHTVFVSVDADCTVRSTRYARHTSSGLVTLEWARPDKVTLSTDEIEAYRYGARFGFVVEREQYAGRYSFDAPRFYPLSATRPPDQEGIFDVTAGKEALKAVIRQTLVTAGEHQAAGEALTDFRPGRAIVRDNCGMKNLENSVPSGVVIKTTLLSCEKIPIRGGGLSMDLTVLLANIPVKLGDVGRNDSPYDGIQPIDPKATVRIGTGGYTKTVEVLFYRDGRKIARVLEDKIEVDLAPAQ
jgi:hypothetical protein